MALERSLWQRIRTAVQFLRRLGTHCMFTRIENLVDEGTPDVEGCIEGTHIWIEMKSCARPARAETMIRPKTRPSQLIWHRERTAAGSVHHWVLIQVGDAYKARLYLIPGKFYDEITATESRLAELSVIRYDLPVANVLMRAAQGW